MKERPILFNTAMVRAILDGHKTQTRRPMKPQPTDFTSHPDPSGSELWPAINKNGYCACMDCPFGQPGDRLWVKETWADVNSEYGPAIVYRADQSLSPWTDWCKKPGPDEGAGPSMNYEEYPGEYVMWWTDLLNGAPDHGWRPSIHMPRWASRIDLEITDVRVERLRDISEDDAIAEGVEAIPIAAVPRQATWDNRQDFAQIWNKIYAAKNLGWDDNPWCWVVEFRMVES